MKRNAVSSVLKIKRVKWAKKFIIVVPAMLDEAIKYLEAQSNTDKTFSYEILVVSDGSRDKTVLVAQGYGKTIGSNKLRVLDLEVNRGKGGTVRLVCFFQSFFWDVFLMRFLS